MRFAVLLHHDEAAWESAAPERRDEWRRGHEAFGAAASAVGVRLVLGEALRSGASATTVRRRGRRSAVTDGPVQPGHERLSGLYVLDAPDLDVVVDLVRLLPEEAIEIRPVVDP